MKSKFRENYNDGIKTIWTYLTNNIVVITTERKTSDKKSVTDKVIHYVSDSEATTNYNKLNDKYAARMATIYRDKASEEPVH